MSEIPPYALVLGGGGTKGAYQIGAWRAFRELGLTFNAVVGASVGALNAGLIAQDTYDLALKMWNDIALDDIVNLPADLLERKEKGDDHEGLPTFSELRGYLLKHHGLDAQPLHDLLQSHIDESKIRSSGIDLGITTYELTNFRQVEVFLPDIPVGKLPDYLLASASFPAFRATEIEGRRFTDGGIIDNIPYRMVKNRGYRRIIVVDVSGLGLNRRPDIVGTQTVYLKNSIEMGGILDFDPDFISSFMELGYLDTLRVFGRLHGSLYFIDEGPHDAEISRQLAKMLIDPDLLRDCSEYIVTESDIPLRSRDPEAAALQSIRATLPRDLRDYRDIIVPFAECAALSLDIERIKRYTLEELIDQIRERAEEIEHGDLKAAAKINPRSILELLKRKWSQVNHREGEGETIPYLYDRAFEEISEKHFRAIYLGALRRLYPALPPARIFLKLLTRYPRSR
ncbi:MAG TPA: patatin-like phospholipase family protein [Spirochaetia bacterium]|nr:patatin-like phospholipase family protein [Spirochaetia bacterium]